MFRAGVLRAARRAELCGFRWADSVLEKPYRAPATGEERKGTALAVKRPILELGGKLCESEAKTRAGKRPVFLDHETAGTDVLTLFSPEAGAAKSQPAGNGSYAGQTAWGGWGSNRRPADYEQHARPQHA
jgi:hypothetical protein